MPPDCNHEPVRPASAELFPTDVRAFATSALNVANQLGSVGSSYWVYLDLRPESDLKIAGLIAATLLVCAALALVLPARAALEQFPQVLEL